MYRKGASRICVTAVHIRLRLQQLLAATVFAGLISIGGDSRAQQPEDLPVGDFEYAAKLLCGLQRSPDDMRLARGFYATAINIHNPNRSDMTVTKKLALTFPP